MPAERHTEAVQEGDAAEPRAGGFRHVGIRGPACRREQEPFDLSKKDLRECGDGRRTVGQHAPQSLRDGNHPLPYGPKQRSPHSREPTLEVLRHNFVERRLLGPTSLVTAGRRGASVGAASASRGEPCDRGDHGRTGRWTAKVNIRTLSAGRSGSPPADRNALQQEHESWAHPVHEDQWILPTVDQ